ncbi:class F sortase [Nocardioides cavernaquae]|uniref:Class F sortase n=1 Tax=Nocardioides cavernaquae TaxID=2321396 RepID=A0A3A5HD46_9ACTN|nr:class F sortase [Nocardioides cavernaquae]RJS45960.1 class F sortase [Nocardioides cavernaquae]
MSTNSPLRPPAPHPSMAVGLGVILLAVSTLVGLIVAWSFLPSQTGGTAGFDRPRTAAAEAERPDRPVSAPVPSEPVRLRVPRIGVDTGLMSLGLTPRRELEVPPLSKADTASWYDRSPNPGDVGPAIVAGHVDSRTGPAVFFRLRELRRGDRVLVDRSDGRRATFTVDHVDEVAKDAFPTRRVYGATPRPELRLITCGGDFDAAAGHYLANVVVFAHLTDLTPA